MRLTRKQFFSSIIGALIGRKLLSAKPGFPYIELQQKRDRAYLGIPLDEYLQSKKFDIKYYSVPVAISREDLSVCLPNQNNS